MGEQHFELQKFETDLHKQIKQYSESTACKWAMQKSAFTWVTQHCMGRSCKPCLLPPCVNLRLVSGL